MENFRNDHPLKTSCKNIEHPLSGGGAYSLKLTPEQFEQFKTAGFFNGLKLQATVEPSKTKLVSEIKNVAT